VDRDISTKLKRGFLKLVKDRDYRELLFLNIKKYSFRDNKQIVVDRILKLLNN